MNEEKKDSKHHVAWADRLGLNKLWFDDMKACSLSFGTDEYPIMVARFENDVVNIKSGPQLKDIITEYKRDKLDPLIDKLLRNWINAYPQESQNSSYLRDQEIFLEKKKTRMLCNFILQLLENNGFGFYKSELDGEYDTM